MLHPAACRRIILVLAGMSLFSFRKPQVLTSLQEQGGELLAEIRNAAAYTKSHAGSLLSLFRLEVAEYAAQQRKRMVLFAAAGVAFFVGYLLLCVLAVIVLEPLCGSWLWAVVAVFSFNVIVGILVLVKAMRSKPAPLAAATRAELKNDLECLKILLSKENKNS